MFFLWSQVLTEFNAQDLYMFNSHYTLLFKAMRMSFETFTIFSHENLTIATYVATK